MTLDAWRRAGGVPAFPVGEDRAFVTALRRVDAHIRHAPGVRVVVSGRIQGRAAGGMADTMRRRMVRQDPLVDDRLEPARDQERRSALRARVRAARAAGVCPAALAQALGVTRSVLAHALGGPYFGVGWAMLEACSPVLVRRPVTRADLPRETVQARRIRDRLRRELRAPVAADPAAMSFGAVAVPA